MSNLQWFVDRVTSFHGHLWISGWAFHPDQRICEMGVLLPGQKYVKVEGYGLESGDVEQHYGSHARDCRFAFVHTVADEKQACDLKLVFTLADGKRLQLERLSARKLATDPYHALVSRFFTMLHEHNRGAILEIGSRNRSGTIRRDTVPPKMRYVGLDVVAGENVDVVGDAHAMSALFEPAQFDAVFSMSVFEHLIMPWKVAIEMNRVMKPGAFALITTHQTFPMHDQPWDFWRFSDRAWSGLFNRHTGFKILGAALGERATIVPDLVHPVTAELESGPAFLASAVLCRKIGETELRWNVDSHELLKDEYPG